MLNLMPLNTSKITDTPNAPFQRIVAVFQLELVQAEKFRHYFCHHLQVFQIFNREKSFVNFQKLFMTAKVKIVAMKEIVIF